VTSATYRFAGGATIVLGHWDQNIQDAGEAFEAIADHQKKIWQKQFAQEGRYTGAAWSPLSPPYARWKAKNYPGKPILQRTGKLMESMTQRPFGIDEITDKSMTIGTDVPYAQYHQRGTEHMPARPLIGPPPTSDVKVFAKIMQSWIVRRNVNV
jgi:phage gpG-like protein